jgi:peptide/nickel transport system substrate-binding protein
MKFGRLGLYAAALAVALAAPASAADLKIGIIRGNPSIDPHFTTSVLSYEVNSSMFEPLVRISNDGKMGPWLAKSWKVIDDTTWEFKLQEGVKWHDGKPFTGEDVAFTYQRARAVPKSPSSYANYLRAVKEVQVIDPLTIRIITNGPAPTLLNSLISVLIVSKHAGENATTDDYQSGKAMIGTGPYKFSSWTANDTVIVTRNDDYWGGPDHQKPSWDKVSYIAMPNAASRIAALRSGDIDVALSVPPQDVAALKKDPKISVVGGPPNRMAFLATDQAPRALDTGLITGPNGEKLDRNPLADQKVRQALRLAIDLNALKDKIYLGLAKATGQLVHENMFGYIPGVGVWKADPAKAKQLLQESGWAGKFKMTISTSDTNFPLVVPLTQAIAQLWSQIGIPTQVSVLQESVFVQKRNEGQIPIYPANWSNPSGTAEDIFPAVIHTRNTAAGWGATNQTNYSNKEVDKLLETALTTMDNAKREELLRQAGKIALDDAGIIPLMSIYEMHATRKGIIYKPRNDAYSLIQNIVPDTGAKK